MTLLTTLMTALLQILSLSGGVRDSIVTKDDDLRDRNNQEAFHEEDMFSAGQMGHCPHG